MTSRPRLSAGFAEPILWGMRRGYSVREISEGLGIDIDQVIEALEIHGPEWLGKQVRRKLPSLPKRVRLKGGRTRHSIDPQRHDPAYLAWARAQTGASLTLDALAAKPMAPRRIAKTQQAALGGFEERTSA